MLEGATRTSNFEKTKKWFISLVFLVIGMYFVSIRGEFTYIDQFDLIIHEAGHLFFSFFGNTMHMLGGTLMQIIVPVLLIIFCFYNFLRPWFQGAMILLAQNLLNISVYVEDAKVMKLKLFGPPGAKHDWNTLLTHFNMLDSYQDVAMGFDIAAYVVIIVMFLAPLYIHD